MNTIFASYFFYKRSIFVFKVFDTYRLTIYMPGNLLIRHIGKSLEELDL